MPRRKNEEPYDSGRTKAGGLDMWLEQWLLQGLVPVMNVAMAPRVSYRLENAHP